MPQMLGTEVASRINKLCMDAQVELPKMFYCSAEADSLVLQKALFDAGMQALITKPINYVQLK